MPEPAIERRRRNANDPVNLTGNAGVGMRYDRTTGDPTGSFFCARNCPAIGQNMSILSGQ